MKGSRATREELKLETTRIAVEKGLETKKQLNEVGDKILKKGMLPKDALGFNDVVMEGLYAQAYRLYNTGKYVDASHLFRMLILLNTTEPKYTLGLAACFHMLKEYKNAAQAYTMCGLLDPESPIPHYHASDCYLHMNDKVSAIVSFEIAVKRSGDKPEYVTLKDRALLSIEALKKEISGFSENPSSSSENK